MSENHKSNFFLKTFLKKINEYLVQYIEKHSKISILIAIFFISAIITTIPPFVIHSIVINNDVISKASNDGWASFWGSYLGGIFGGAGTLIAVAVTTQQAKSHQIQNIAETRKIQEENLSESRKIQRENHIQIYISNINEKIRDYRQMIKEIDECTDYNNEIKNILVEKGKILKREDVGIISRMGFNALTKISNATAIALNTEIVQINTNVVKLHNIFGKSINALRDDYYENKNIDNKIEIIIKQINDANTGLIKLSTKLNSGLTDLYFDKYKNLEN